MVKITICGKLTNILIYMVQNSNLMIRLSLIATTTKYGLNSNFTFVSLIIWFGEIVNDLFFFP